MRRAVFLLLGLVGLLLVAEVGLRVRGVRGLTAREVWTADGQRLEAGRAGWLDGAWWETDGEGQRIPGAPADAPAEIWAVGGRFTAALGLEADATYWGRLQGLLPQARPARSYVVRPVVVAGDLGARGERLRQMLAKARPAGIVLQIEAEDLGRADQDLSLGHPDVVQLGGGPAAPLATVQAVQGWLGARRRAAAEARVKEQIEQDGLLSRAGDNLHKLLNAMAAATGPDRLPEDHQQRLALAVLEESYSALRGAERGRARDSLEAILRATRPAGVPVILLCDGPLVVSRPLRDLAEFLDVPVVHVPPYHWDGALRIAGEVERPAAMIHELTAPWLLEELVLRGVVKLAGPLPTELTEAARRVREEHLTSLGQEASLVKSVARWVPRSLQFDRDWNAQWIFAGLDETCRLGPGTTVTLVLGHLPDDTDLFLSVELPEGAAPPRLKAWIRGLTVTGEFSQRTGRRGEAQYVFPWEDAMLHQFRIPVQLFFAADSAPTIIELKRLGWR